MEHFLTTLTAALPNAIVDLEGCSKDNISFELQIYPLYHNTVLIIIVPFFSFLPKMQMLRVMIS